MTLLTTRRNTTGEEIIQVAWDIMYIVRLVSLYVSKNQQVRAAGILIMVALARGGLRRAVYPSNLHSS